MQVLNEMKSSSISFITLKLHFYILFVLYDIECMLSASVAIKLRHSVTAHLVITMYVYSEAISGKLTAPIR